MGFTYPIPDRWCMCTISYSIPRWRTAISCGQCRSSNMIYYAEMHRQTVEKLTWLKGTHRKPKHAIYVRYFSILLYLLNVQVAPTEKKTSLKLWWRISLNVLSWQDSETRPGEFVIFMLSIIIELEHFEVNRLYKTRSWQMGFISRHRWGKKIIFIKKTDPAFYTPFLFIKYLKTTHWKHHIHVIIQNVKKRGIFSIEKNYGAFKLWGFSILIRFFRNILHLKKKHYFFGYL